MEKAKLKLIVKNLKLLVEALESEVYSDLEQYAPTGEKQKVTYKRSNRRIMTVGLVSVTPDAEKTMDILPEFLTHLIKIILSFGLLKYCIQHQHWSVFEQSTMTLEIETTRAIAVKFCSIVVSTFQEFSQRYADSSQLGVIPIPEYRRQDTKNRQNSTDDLDPFIEAENGIADKDLV